MRHFLSKPVTFLHLAVILLIGIGFGMVIRGTLAFTEPSQSPPGGNVPPPINVGSSSQTKAGDFTAANLFAGLIRSSGDVQAAGGSNIVGGNGYIYTSDVWLRNVGRWASQGSTSATLDQVLAAGNSSSRNMRVANVGVGGYGVGTGRECEGCPDAVNGTPNLWLTANDRIRLTAGNGIWVSGPEYRAGPGYLGGGQDRTAYCPDGRIMVGLRAWGDNGGGGEIEGIEIICR